ncbi:uncharacterized protein LOC112509444 [Cynara cardunculus var. scolymus]|uniref:Uncharacterized protein n=1 Tax=Cynara cardunculus var. scolymus TaxID=59895 RepID=A0A103YBH2_CYNCS|nr:uncharacterized protein LOC112509444 [Cynara cardunculus var. scolymus]KVI06039.1 hypothetical protein Ccrd_015624 [Cynara cardunculus var. scolymus]
MASSLRSSAAVNLCYHRCNSSMLAATNPQLPSIQFMSSGNCSKSSVISASRRSSLLPPRNSYFWLGRCGATSPHPPSPPESGPPPGEEEDSDSGSVASLSRFQESVQIFFAVLFWMSLFFWSSVWDGRKKGRSDKGPRFWK